MKLFRILTACLLGALLSACGTVTTPKSTKEAIMVSYPAIAGVRDVATNLLLSAKITPADARNIQAQADAVRAGLDIAKDIFTADCPAMPAPAVPCASPAAATKLEQTLLVLQALQSYLRAQGGQL
jgi:hypothetical protein